MHSPEYYMQLALELAARGRYTVSPNPMVGCVIVKNGEIIGTGYHQKAGEPHAEIHALNAAGNQAQNATAYISLEPCVHYGRTAPCCNQLIAAGIKKVIVACLDPNPLVKGKGVEMLRAAGINVEVGLCQPAAEKLNEFFCHYITTKRPFVISKWAMSLDGKTITHADDSKQISSQASQYHCHDLRQSVDAILVGANTIRCDDPQLTVRFTSSPEEIKKHPIRVILTTHGKFPFDAKIFSSQLPGKTIVVSTEPLEDLKKLSIENWVLPKNNVGQVDLKLLLQELGKREISSLLVEGGMTLHQSFIQENLINQYQVQVAPVVIGNLTTKQPLLLSTISQLGNDIHITCNKQGEA